MKLLLCLNCNDILSPHMEAKRVRTCSCKKHSFWWDDPFKGYLSVYDHHNPNGNVPFRFMSYVLCIPNLFLESPDPMGKEEIQEIYNMFSPSFLFRHQKSCIVRVRPGEVVDVQWADSLPALEPVI